MQLPAYSSLAAFLAHYRALKSAASRSSDDEQLLAAMSAVIATLSTEMRAALESNETALGARRHRERAELHLVRELVARHIVSG